MKGVYIFLADGFEDVEALGTNDVLRRAGLQSQLISVGEDPFATSSHGVTVSVDGCLPYMEVSHKGTTEKDILIFPGGMPGSKTLAACKPLIKLMQEHLQIVLSPLKSFSLWMEPSKTGLPIMMLTSRCSRLT